jgi:rhodanese-related sulfurtransferase
MGSLSKMTAKNLSMMVTLILLVSVAVMGVGCLTEGMEAQISRCREEGILAQEAFSLIEKNKNNADFIIIDLRFPQDFEKEHIEGAINIDITSETFRDELDKLDRNNTYLTYCYCACGGVGWNASRTMEELGFKKVCNMWDGIKQWREEGLPTVKGPQML